MASIAGSRTLITGGAGTVGSTIADHLVRQNAAEVIVLDDFSRGRRANLAWALNHGRVRVVVGDIRDTALLATLMKGVDVVFHQAALRITRCATDPRLGHEVLAGGTFNVIEAAAAAGVRRLVAASSASVYGQAAVLPTTEDHHPWANETLYGAAKVYNEGLLRSFHATHGLNYVALRYFNVYGPRMDIEGVYTEVLVRWMDRLAAGQRPVVLGDGSQTMDFVYVDDVARANLLAAEADVADEVFNIATGVQTSLVELAESLGRAMGADGGVEFGPERPVAVRHRLADTSKARRLLGFEAQVGLDEGLDRLVEWWTRENRAAAA